MKVPSERFSSFIIIEDSYLKTFIHSLLRYDVPPTCDKKPTQPTPTFYKETEKLYKITFKYNLV